MNHDADLVEILRLTNQARAHAGVLPLWPESRLSAAAQHHAEYLAAGGFLSHGGPHDSTPGDRVCDCGYAWQAVGENVLARTLAQPGPAFEQWWFSEGHRANLLDERFSQVGMGRAYSPRVDCWYYVMDLAAPAV